MIPAKGITAGSHLFCCAKPGLLPGTFLTSGEFGRRQLEKTIFIKEEIQGEQLSKGFDLGPLAIETFDLSRPKHVTTVDPLSTVAVLGELVWEVVRLRDFPDHPSRLDCLYFWQEEAQGRDWLSSRTWPACLYAVEVIECHRVFVADMGKVQFDSENGTLAFMMAQARRYWSEESHQSDNAEVLLEGKVRVITAIDTRGC